ncbi:hypothetical protein VNO78_25246 [Psophocarpus tetragonolobus]|uniref:Uncharacterized protein n=1 Tax=Psophocarpus tetragonolobus TaxID=3891 RepID=A0AAN9S959_PSOTE
MRFVTDVAADSAELKRFFYLCSTESRFLSAFMGRAPPLDSRFFLLFPIWRPESYEAWSSMDLAQGACEKTAQ